MTRSLLTPIAKAWSSEYGIDANRLAIQVLGGCGYTHDYPVERLYRDNRLNAIVEGTTGIQALDLLGRKVPMADGAALGLLLQKMEATITRAASVSSLAEYAHALGATCKKVGATTMALMAVAQTGDFEKFLANATPFLHLFGHTVVAWLWLKQGLVIDRELQKQPTDNFHWASNRPFTISSVEPKVDQWIQVLSPIDTTCPIWIRPGLTNRFMGSADREGLPPMFDYALIVASTKDTALHRLFTSFRFSQVCGLSITG